MVYFAAAQPLPTHVRYMWHHTGQQANHTNTHTINKREEIAIVIRRSFTVPGIFHSQVVEPVLHLE